METNNSIQLNRFTANNRAILQKYGENVGKQLFVVREGFTDPAAKQTLRTSRENNTLFLSKAVKHYYIEKINIMGIALAINANEKPVIVLNAGIPGVKEIQCALVEPDFNKKVSSTSVREALEKQKADINDLVYFSDLAALTKEVNSLNTDTLRDVNRLMEYLGNQKKILVSDTELNNEYLVQYVEQLDKEHNNNTASTTIRVETTETEE